MRMHLQHGPTDNRPLLKLALQKEQRQFYSKVLHGSGVISAEKIICHVPHSVFVFLSKQVNNGCKRIRIPTFHQFTQLSEIKHRFSGIVLVVRLETINAEHLAAVAGDTSFDSQQLGTVLDWYCRLNACATKTNQKMMRDNLKSEDNEKGQHYLNIYMLCGSSK